MKADISSYKKSSFGPAFAFLSKEQREALAVYYAFTTASLQVKIDAVHTNFAVNVKRTNNILALTQCLDISMGLSALP